MHRQARRMIVPILIVFLAAVSTGRAQETKGKPAEKIPDVVAKVNGKKITGKEYQRAYSEIVGNLMAQSKGTIPPDHMGRFKPAVVEQLIAAELLLQKADQLKIAVKGPDVDAELEKLKKQMGPPENYKQFLERQGIKESELKERIKRTMAIKALIDREITGKVKVTPQDVKTYYDTHPDEFKVPERVKARHILIMVPEKSPPKTKEEAIAKIKEAQKLVNKGEDFGEVAKKFSQDGTAQRGGELGYVVKGQMVPEFEKAAFSLKPGKVSSIVETKFGYHLIKVEDYQKASTHSFADVEKNLTDFLKNQRTQKELQTYVKDLIAKAKIEKTQF